MGSAWAAVLARALSAAAVAHQWAPGWTMLCRHPRAKGLRGLAKHNDMALRAWSLAGGSSYLGKVPKTAPEKTHPSQHLQFKIAQNEICWAKEKLCTPVCWSFPLQEGSNELQGSGWRGNSFSSPTTARLEWHTEVSWMWQAVGTSHILQCVITSSSSCLSPEAFLKGE